MNDLPSLPGSEPALAASIGWVNAVLLGSLATGLCILAISLVGLLMLMGHLPIRHGMRVILGSFVLLSAPAIASGLAGAWESASPPAPEALVILPQEAREPLPPADYDPYAGASLRRK